MTNEMLSAIQPMLGDHLSHSYNAPEVRMVDVRFNKEECRRQCEVLFNSGVITADELRVMLVENELL